MRTLFFSMLFLTWVQSAVSQVADWHLEGRVLDENGYVLSGVTLQTDNQQAISDSAGQFRLPILSKSGWLTVRYIGYFPQRILLDTLSFIGPKARLDIFMQSNAVGLPEVAITSKPMESIFEEDFQTNLLDYAFAGENLILLVQDRKNYFLQLATDNGQKITELQLPKAAQLLHRSCTGDLHVVGGQNAWEITLSQNRIDTFPRYETTLFYQLVKPCVLEQQGYYFFQKIGAYRQSVEYMYFDPDRRQQHLATIRNVVAEAQLQRRHLEILASYMRLIPDLDRDDILNGYSPLTDPKQVLKPENLTRMAETNALVRAIGFFSAMAEDSVYAPLIEVGQKIYLLDHVNDKLLRISIAPRQDQISDLHYHHSKGWQKEIIVDNPLNRVYGRFSQNSGNLILKEINLESGGVRKTYNLRIAPYLSNNFKIRNGMVYFIGQPDVNFPNRRLYRLNIYTFAE